MSSLFSKIFSYREREYLSPLENFLTEIFSYCLKHDLEFRQDFFTICLNVNIDNIKFEIETQKSYDKYGRPDIEVICSDSVFLFECKVEASERQDQLKDYCNILTKHKSNLKEKYIVFLTKYFENTKLVEPNVNFIHVRWHSVFNLINSHHGVFTNQLKLFLEENKMNKENNFTIQDLLALKTIAETISKMDELLEQIKPIFTDNFGNFRREQTLQGLYDGYSTFYFDKKEYYLISGFWWDDESEIPMFGLWIRFPRKKFEATEIISILNKEFSKSDWVIEENDSFHYYIQQPLTAFISDESDSISLMKKFIEENIIKILNLKKKNSLLFKN